MEIKHILYVEDNDLKFRAVERLLRWEGLPVARASTFAQLCDHMLIYSASVTFLITDWSFPLGGELQVAEACAGAAVVKMATDLGLPYAVISGHDRPPDFEGTWIVDGNADEIQTLVRSIKNATA